jgi:flagellar basal-body rod protein FlgB
VPRRGPGISASVAAGPAGALNAEIAAAAAAGGKSLPRRTRGSVPKQTADAPLWLSERLHGFGTALALAIPRGAFTIMFDNIFGIHEQALLLHGQRLGVLATNLANADTPGYKARDIDFSAVLSQTQGETQLPMQVTHAEHINFSGGELPSGELKYRNPYQASLDGNTVEMPVEQAAFSENNVRYQASLNFINLRISELQFVIAGQ